MGIYRDRDTGNYGIRIKYFRRDIKKIIGPDKKKAELALQEVRQEIRLSKLTGQGWAGFEKLQRARKPKMFADAVESYVEERVNYKHSTRATVGSIIRAYLLPEFGTLPLTAITESQVRKFQAKVAGKVSAVTTNTIMQPFRSIMAQAYREGDISRDPCMAVKRVEEPKADIDPLSDDELQLALAKVDSHYRSLFICLAFTGARPNELLALRWRDLDWHRKEISITKGRVRGYEGRPKTKSSERKIPMLSQVEQVLTEMKDGKLISLDGYVFINKKGIPIDRHLARIWSRALKDAGLRHRPSYQLRHTFATQCIIKGLPLPFIAKVLGHSTIDTLIRHYAGWIDSITKETEKRLVESFRSTLILPPTPQISKVEGKGEGRSKRANLRIAQR